MAINPMNTIRTELTALSISTPATGPDAIEAMNRIRRWTLDLAGSMVPIYLSVNAYGMDLTSDTIDDLIRYARAEAETPVEEYQGDMPSYRALLAELPKSFADAIHYEDVSDYSVAYGASRAALQAIQTAVSSPDDFDIFSLSIRAGTVAEQCALAEAYFSLAVEHDGPVAPKQVSIALEEVRKDRGMNYLGSLCARIYDNIPTLDREESLPTGLAR